MTNLRTKTQNKQLHKLLGELNLGEEKESLVLQFTNGRTNRSSKMKEWECAMLIKYLNNEKQRTPEERQADKMRKKIIALFRKMGHITESGNANMQSIESWVLKYGYMHKPLNDYTYTELPKLVSQAEAAHNHYLKSIY